MSIAQRLVNFSDGLSAEGILSAAKGGTGNTTGGGTTSPTISQIGYLGNDTATDVAGGGLITLTGTNFASGAKVLINTTPVAVVTVVSSTQITFTAPALAAGSYILYVVNLDGSTAIAVPGIQYSGVPAWSTAAGTLGTSYETAAISSTLSATSNSAVTYSIFSGTLPSGATLNSNGTISGTSPLVSGSTTYTFTVRATDAELQDTDRQFSLTVNPDVVTWSSSNTVTLAQDTASTTTLLATSAAGQTVSYATDTLPTGLTRSGDIVSGTPTVAGTTITTATATAAVTGKTAQQTITWTVSVAADANWRYTTLLLNSENTTLPFATDASTNNFAVTVVGDTKPSNFNPYTPGYYSNYFDGTGDSLTVTGNGSVVNFGTGDFTIETWAYALFNLTGAFSIIDTCPGGVVSPTNRILVFINTDGSVYYQTFQGQTNLIVSAAGAVKAAQWTHVALVKFNNQTKLYVNGTQVGSTYADTLNYPAQTNRPILSANGYDGGSYNSTGYLSNYRIVKGTAVYTTNFTPPTQPLTAVAGTSLLTCQSNRLVDLSTNAYTMTKTGDVAVSSFDPFTPNTSYATYGSTYFDGTGDYLTVPQNAAFNFGTGDFTVEGWYYLTAIVTDQALLMLGTGANGGGPYTGWWLRYQSAGQLNFYRYDGGETNTTFSTTLAVNTWYHIACTRSGTNLKMFVNGVQVGATATSSTSFNNVNSDPLVIGRVITGGGTFHLNGYVSDVRIVKGTAVYTTNFTPPAAPLTAVTNTSLLTCQTNQPTSNSQFIDNSTLGGVVTRFGNTTQGSFSPYGANWSNYFNGSTDYLDINYTALQSYTGNATIECWFKLNALPTGTSYNDSMYIIGSNPSASNPGIDFAVGSNAIWFSQATYPQRTLAGTWTPNLNWHHIAVTRNTNTWTMWLDGVSIATATSSDGFSTATIISIGRCEPTGGEATGYMNGYISNLRIVKGTALYTSAFTPSTQPLTAITNTSLLTCQSPNFVDNSLNASVITPKGTISTQKFNPFATVVQTPQTHSVYFNGTNLTSFATPVSAEFTFGTGAFTIEAWVNPSVNAATVAQWIYGNVTTNTGNTQGGLTIKTNGTLQLQTWNTALATTTAVIPLNTWTHVAGSFDGTTYRLFVNGVLSATGTTVYNLNANGPGTIGHNGTLGAANSTFTGHISNARVVKGSAVYTANFTPSTQPLTAISGTVLLTCQDATIRDNSTNQFTLTATSTPQPRAFNPFGYTTSNSQDYSPQTFGGSMYFDNSGDYLALPTSNTYLIGSGDFTIECWVYKRSTTFDAILSYSSSTGLRIFVNSTGGLELWLGATQQWTFPAIIRNNSWDHVAFVRTGTALTGYVNGTAVATATVSTNYNAGTLNIGAEAGGSPWGGYISDFRIIRGQALYTANFVPPQTPLTASINTMLLINGDKSAIADKSGKVMAETVGDARISTAIKKYGTASLYFDGTGDTLKIPASPNFQYTGDYTVEFWIYFNSVSTEVDIVGNYISNVATDWMILKTANGTFQFYPSSASSYIAGPTPVINTWYHVAGVRNGTSLKLYVNGVSVGTALTFSGTLGDATKSLYVGSRGGTTNFLNGYIDDLRISRFARYTANFTPPTSTLLTK